MGGEPDLRFSMIDLVAINAEDDRISSLLTWLGLASNHCARNAVLDHLR